MKLAAAKNPDLKNSMTMNNTVVLLYFQDLLGHGEHMSTWW